jgi:hypothetical protein
MRDQIIRAPRFISLIRATIAELLLIVRFGQFARERPLINA